MSALRTTLVHRLRRVVDVEPREVRGLSWAFVYHFCLLCSYYVLRPIRDEMGIAGGVDKMQWLFLATFLAMVAIVPLFGWLTSRAPRKRWAHAQRAYATKDAGVPGVRMTAASLPPAGITLAAPSRVFLGHPREGGRFTRSVLFPFAPLAKARVESMGLSGNLTCSSLDTSPPLQPFVLPGAAPMIPVPMTT
jgi:hypothetical protein